MCARAHTPRKLPAAHATGKVLAAAERRRGDFQKPGVVLGRSARTALHQKNGGGWAGGYAAMGKSGEACVVVLVVGCCFVVVVVG